MSEITLELGPRFRIAASGGHSRSVAVVIDENSQIRAVAETSLPTLNHHVFDTATVTQCIQRLFDTLAQRLDIPRDEFMGRVDKVVVAIAGAATERDRLATQICFIDAGWPAEQRESISVVDDTWAGLLAGVLSYDGLCAFAGTGASVYVGEFGEGETDIQVIGGRPRKLDGWGAFLGDKGSAFQLACDAFRTITDYHDETGDTLPLFDRIRDRVNQRPNELGLPRMGSLDTLQRWFDILYQNFDKHWRIKFALTATGVVQAAKREPADQVAINLVNDAATAMAKTIRCGARRNNFRSTLPITLQGGMFEHSSVYRRAVRDKVADLTTGEISLARYRPVVGTIIMLDYPFPTTPPPNIEQRIDKMLSGAQPADRPLLIRDQKEASIARPSIQ